MNVGFSFRGMRDVSQGELSWREEELTRCSVRESFNNGQELLEGKGGVNGSEEEKLER